MKPKKEFISRMEKLLGKEIKPFLESIQQKPRRAIRCNTLKIKQGKLKKSLENKGWDIEQLDNETFIINNQLKPGELGKAREHLLGYYYIQSMVSQLPIKVLKPKPNELLLDLAAAPGSKTTQACQYMNNKGTIIANDIDRFRAKNLGYNIDRCGCMNTIITCHNGIDLTKRLKRIGVRFDKILLDMPCSAEGTSRSKPEILEKWNKDKIKKLSRMQKEMASSAIELLKPRGELLYSTCTFAPEENERIVSYLLDNFNVKINKINLAIKTREGVTEWEEQNYNQQVKKAARIYPHDNDSEGFFLAKLTKK